MIYVGDMKKSTKVIFVSCAAVKFNRIGMELTIP